jgi:hypothetical protein
VAIAGGILIVDLLQQNGLSATQWQPTIGAQTDAQQPACDKPFPSPFATDLIAAAVPPGSLRQVGSFAGIFILVSLWLLGLLKDITTRSTSPDRRS